jgi:hypothetical protein
MKNLILLLLLSVSVSLSAQKIDGFYTGVLRNDSANRMIQQYELAIAMYKGKITGYSYVTFIVNDTFYYGIREVKGEIRGDSMVIEDDKFVANNFPESPAKKVKRTITIPLNGQDSLMQLNGSWKTNRTKKYYSVPGKIDLARSKDSAHSPLINHLKELNIIPVYNNYANDVAQNSPSQPATTAKTEKAKPAAVQHKPEETLQPAAKMPVTQRKIEPIAVAVPVTAAKTPQPIAIPVKLPFNQRKTALTQRVEINSDSITLAFYDNGVVDGDSISVYMNGQPVVTGARLTTTATKKTISIAGIDEVELVLVAENLGSLPPNTGLLTIRDGEAVYQVHFSADMQTNASIIIRRKKK